MKKHLALIFGLGILSSPIFCIAQGKTMKELDQEDSIELAAMPKAVRDNFAKMYPDAKNVKWTVFDFEYSADFNPGNPEAEHYISNDGQITVSFYHNGPKANTWYKTEKKYTRWESINNAVPKDVLAKITAEVKAQNDEEVASIESVECSDNCIATSGKKNGKLYEKQYADKGYRVWGNKTGMKDGGMYIFSSTGDYVPCYEHDMMYNEKYKKN